MITIIARKVIRYQVPPLIVNPLPGSVHTIDYEAPVPFELIFKANVTSDGDRMCINVTTIDDTALEGGEYFFVSILSTSPPLPPQSLPAEIRVVINDNDSKHKVAQGHMSKVCNEQSNTSK